MSKKLCVVLMLSLFLLSGCGREFKKSGYYVDTLFTVAIKAKGGNDGYARVTRAADQGFSTLIQLDSSINPYSPISEISAINANAAHCKVEVSPLTHDLVRKAVNGSQLTDGYYDCTWGKLASLFINGATPSTGQVSYVRFNSGYNNIATDKGVNVVRLANSLTILDFDTVKEGYAVDVFVNNLKKANSKIGSGMIRAGSAYYSFGRHKEIIKIGGRKYKIKSKNQGCAIIDGEAQYYKDAARWRHYVGLPTTDEEILSVVVVAPNAMTAQVLANAFFVMGSEKALAKIKEIKKSVDKPGLYNMRIIVKQKDGKNLVVSTM